MLISHRLLRLAERLVFPPLLALKIIFYLWRQIPFICPHCSAQIPASAVSTAWSVHRS